MVKRILFFGLSIWLVMFASACGSDSENNATPSYKEMKSMVVDILKTEEAQKAIEEATKKSRENQPKLLQMLNSPEGEQVKIAIKDIMTDPGFPKVLEDLMTDPKFAGEFAKAVQKENKEIHKELLKDPEYQTLLLDVLKNKEFSDLMIDLMKTKPYRQLTMDSFREALENPVFKLELIELMKKALEEENKEEKNKGTDQGGQQDSGSEDSGTGEGGGRSPSGMGGG